MSWLFSQALGAACWEENSLDGKPFAQLNVIPTQHKFWHNGKTTDVSNLSRFGLTYRVLTEPRGEELLTWFREASRARTSHAPAKEQDSKANEADCGQKCPELSVKSNHDTPSLRTHQCSLLEDSPQSLPTLTRWGSMRNGVVSERMPLVRHTSAKGSGSSLPTPSGCRSGKNHVAGRLDEWGGSSNRWRGTEIGKLHLPPFEEWVMGWPVQWTELTQSAMVRFRQWQQQHGIF